MNRDETAELLRRRHRLTGHNFNAEVLDTWTEMTHDIDYGEAVVAMDRAARKDRHVNWYEFHEELDAHRHARRISLPNRAEEVCAWCDNTGWRQAPSLIGKGPQGEFLYSQVEPCDHEPPPDTPARRDIERVRQLTYERLNRINEKLRHGQGGPAIKPNEQAITLP